MSSVPQDPPNPGWRYSMSGAGLTYLLELVHLVIYLFYLDVNRISFHENSSRICSFILVLQILHKTENRTSELINLVTYDKQNQEDFSPKQLYALLAIRSYGVCYQNKEQKVHIMKRKKIELPCDSVVSCVHPDLSDFRIQKFKSIEF